MQKADPPRILWISDTVVYSTACACRQSYTGENGRPLEEGLREHKHNLKQGLKEKSKLAQHAYNEVHHIIWNKPRFYKMESKGIWRNVQRISLENTGKPA
jgi:hypothetical protein